MVGQGAIMPAVIIPPPATSTSQAPSLGWQEADPPVVLLPPPDTRQEPTLEGQGASAPSVVATLPDPFQDPDEDVDSTHALEREDEDGGSVGPGPTSSKPRNRVAWAKQKRANKPNDEPWGEYLRGKIRLNKIRERVFLLQESKLQKELELLERELKK
ncbi:hypothetical protein ElyMa_004139700 [Elysia marginata]|uniref:BZIP domain-containing protein n=1 Tax=Elysia marginata TaxID=1093978 RepID=A0AAV4GG26_9GAST|nr:hypothetical protein ElyMa_004139700 [Elysia marginata]